MLGAATVQGICLYVGEEGTGWDIIWPKLEVVTNLTIYNLPLDIGGRCIGCNTCSHKESTPT